VPIEAVLKITADILTAADRLAERFVALFLEHLLMPFYQAGMPPNGWAALTAALERQRPLGVGSVAAAVSLKLQERVNQAMITLDAAPYTKTRESGIPSG
jgi:hypothetical protein